MKKIKSIILLTPVLLFILGAASCDAQIPNAKTVSVNVYGNCGMCKKTIEQAGNKRNKALVDWDAETKKAKITFNEKKTNIDKVLKRIAEAGYDNEKYYAPDDVYDELHGCCQYDRKPKTESKTNKKL